MSFNFVIPEFNINGAGTPPLQFFRRGFNLGSSGSTPEWKDIILHGNTALTLVNAKEDGLNYLTLFGGTELLPEQYLDTVTLSGGCEQRNLPSEYTQVNYVTNTAQTMINTGVKFDFSKNYEIELKASGVTGSWYILQARENSGAPISGISGSLTGNVIGLNFNGAYVASSQISRVFGHIYYIKGTINNGNMTLYIKDETAGTEETVTGTYTPITGQSVDIGLFGNVAGNYVAINSDVYFVRIKEDDNYIMDYVPCRQSATAGFYDKVSGTFKTASNLVADGNTVPSPDTPIDIVSNNGVLKARHQSGLPLGYTLLDYIESTGTQYIDTGYKPKTGDKIRVVYQYNSLYGGEQYNEAISIFGCTDAASAWDAFSGVARVTQGPNTINRIAWGKGTNSVVGVAYNNETGVWYDLVCDNGVFTINDTQLGATSANSFSANYSMYLFARNTGGTAGLITKGKIQIAQVWDNGTLVHNMIPAKNSSNVVGMYDLVSGTFFTNGGTGTFTAGNTIDDLEIYTDGTQEVVTDSLGNTASAEMLLAVGTYKDTQEVLTGGVTRNIGIKVLDGTESWAQSDTKNDVYRLTLTDAKREQQAILSTHFIGTDAADVNMPSNSIKVGSYAAIPDYGVIAIRLTNVTALATFKQYLASQYAQGTPVIIVYPTSSATTESVSGQFLSKSPVTQTAGSISNLPIAITESSHTTPTPQQPLQINCNNGVLKVSPNLFDKNSTLANNRIWAPGFSQQDLDNYYGTNIIKVIGGHTYTRSGEHGGANYFKLSDNTYTQVSNSDATITVPDNAVEWVFNNKTTTDRDTMMVVEGSSLPAEYMPYGQIYTDGTTETVEVTGKNLFNKNNLPERIYAYFVSSGTTWTYSSGGYSLRFPCLPNTIYTARYNGNSAQAVLSFASTSNDNVPTSNQATVTVTQAIRQNSPTINTPITLTTGVNDKWLIVQYNAVDPQNTDMRNNLQIELGSTATTYEPYYNGGSAMAEMLLKLGTYQDVQSVLDGGVTRKVGVKVLDGTENWFDVTGYTGIYGLAVADGVLPSNTACVCSHYLGTTASNVTMENDTIKAVHASLLAPNKISIYIKDTNVGSLANFKTFLATQYQNGQPIICVYPLVTAITESVTAQPLSTQAGTNIVEITQASMDNLELEVSYKGTV